MVHRFDFGKKFSQKKQFQSVTGIWAPQLDDATCIALNHKYKLMAFGRKK